ncbi:MAG: DUF448 domain-containing protein [Candidatus Limnocylindrus sp.]
MTRKIIRTCIVCCDKRGSDELVRITGGLGAEQEMNGKTCRGAWICRGTKEEHERDLRTVLSRSLRRAVSEKELNAVCVERARTTSSTKEGER